MTPRGTRRASEMRSPSLGSTRPCGSVRHGGGAVQDVDHHLHLEAGLGLDAAGLAHDPVDELGLVLLHQGGDLAQDRGALVVGGGSPAGLRGARLGGGLAHVLGGGVADACDHRAGRGLQHVERAADRGPPLRAEQAAAPHRSRSGSSGSARSFVPPSTPNLVRAIVDSAALPRSASAFGGRFLCGAIIVYSRSLVGKIAHESTVGGNWSRHGLSGTKPMCGRIFSDSRITRDPRGAAARIPSPTFERLTPSGRNVRLAEASGAKVVSNWLLMPRRSQRPAARGRPLDARLSHRAAGTFSRR